MLIPCRAAHAATIALCSSAAAAADDLPQVGDPSFAAFLPSFIEGTERFMRGDTAL